MDCGFKKENGWFRYRAAAIIIEKLKDYVAYPSFFAEKLLDIGDTVEHIVTCE